MSKYIIDVGDAYIRHGLERTLTIPVRINEHEDHWMNTRIPVTPYIEPDIEKVRREEYEKGFDAGRMLNRGKYEKGLNDAWEAARKIILSSKRGGFSIDEFAECFGRNTLKYDVLEDYSASEAVEKISKYELEKEELKVGDEVKCIKENWTAIVTKIKEESLTLMDASGAIANGYEITRFVKTGRHFHEIAAVLAKMKEE